MLSRREPLPRHVRRERLSLVGHGEPLATLRAPALQDDASVLRCHTDEEAVRFLPSARIRLISALALHCVSLPRLDETPILRASCRYCQRWTAMNSARFFSRRSSEIGATPAEDLTRGSPNFHCSSHSACATVPFPSPPRRARLRLGLGFLPKISTRCGKDCGKAPGRSPMSNRVRLTVAVSATSGFIRVGAV
jgi:hypothetical protein